MLILALAWITLENITISERTQSYTDVENKRMDTKGGREGLDGLGDWD